MLEIIQAMRRNTGNARHSASDLREVTARIAMRAEALDVDGAFPQEDIADLASIGVLEAPFGTPDGGAGIAVGAPEPLMEMLRRIGHASLPVGRLIEGHVNAAALITRYGTPAQRVAACEDARGGALFGVWNTEDADGVRLVEGSRDDRLEGRKTFASGSGFLPRPLITARTADGRKLMVLPRLDRRDRSDLSGWRAHGMRASATGSFDFTGLEVRRTDIIGSDCDYNAQPAFSAGAWRFASVQLGGIERLLDEVRSHLRNTGRGSDPHQLARMGEAAIAAETARLWVERASRIAESSRADDDPERTVAYVDLARCAVERCALEVMEAVNRSIGLAAFIRGTPVERVGRDLATYLRQPAPDRALCSGAAYVLTGEENIGELWRCA